jgi:hypothetical protein
VKKTKPPATLPLRYRLAVLSRLVAALLGGWLLVNALAAAFAVHGPRLGLGLGLGWPRADALAWGGLLGLLLMPVLMMGCFHCRRAHQAWLGSALPAALLAATVWWVKP